MLITRRSVLAGGAMAAVSPRLSLAQANWPNKPLRILIGTSPGGSPDIVGRMLADKMSESLGVAITVENNTGGGGGIAASMTTQSPPDGTTMTLLTAGYATGAAIGKFPFDGDATFSCISMVCAYPFIYQVPKDSPIQSFPDLLARAKAAPDKVTYVITSLGSVYHLIGSWVDAAAGVKMVPVPYRGTAPAVADVTAGRVDVMLDTATSGFPRVANGQFRALAVTSPTRYPLMPDVPTVAETLPGVSYLSWLGFATAPGTPRSSVQRVNAEVHRALTLADVQAKLRDNGNIATPTTPDGMRQQMADEIANWRKIISENNIKLE